MNARNSYILSSLRYHWRIHLAVALAVITATAVLTGALVVGDSVRGSLRHLALDRLGQIAEVVVADRFFRADLGKELQAEPGFAEDFGLAVPAVLVEGTVELASAKQPARAGQVTVLGIEPEFWSLGSGPALQPLSASEIVLNAPLAEQLHAKVGDDVLLRIGQASQIPADSPLGRKSDFLRNRRLTVVEILPAEGLARFGLRPNQQLPLNAFVATGTLQSMLDKPDQVNALFISGKSADHTPPAGKLQKLLHPTLADLGLQLERTPTGYLNLTSHRMMLDPAVVDAARRALGEVSFQPAFTYLANYLKVADGRGKIPYSTVTAIDLWDVAPLGPFVSPEGDAIGPLAEDEIVLNRWAADDLAKQGVTLQPGDTVQLEYFEPESTHGQVREKTAEFRLKAIADMTPIVADRNFTPELPGVTDQKSIANWDPPFPYDDSRVRSRKPHDEDEAYWEEYKATPKAFISLNQGQQLWGSRFGRLTSLRIVLPADVSVDELEKRLLGALEADKLGYQFLPVRQWAIAASAGTTPFNLLFFGFSFFLVASAVMLIALLFRLGVEQRAREVGMLGALGLRRQVVGRLLLGEAAIVAAVASVIGAIAGVGYAWLMLVGLQTWWLEAIRTPFLALYVTPLSLVVGVLSGLVVSLLTIVWTLWRMRKIPARRLLADVTEDSLAVGMRGRSRLSAIIGWSLAVLAVLLALAARWFDGEARAGLFFGGGACALLAALLLVNHRLHRGSSSGLAKAGRLALLRLALHNAARNPRRSSLTIGLIASAAFLILALSAFRLDPAAAGIGINSGSGGFALIAESSQPIYQDLNSTAGREELGFSEEAEQVLADSETVALRVQPGDDASCLNLYQTTQPRALGVPRTLIEWGGFAWAGSLAQSEAEQQNPWLLLEAAPPASPASSTGTAEPIPVVMDANTATYSLHKSLGDTLELVDGRSQLMPVRIVGLLKNSIFQGELLMSEENFLSRFPDVSGYRKFLIATPGEDAHQRNNVASALETILGDFGFDAQSSTALLASFFAVQNTYLSTFQSLGGLGLLLGTFGLAAVQMRSMLERRGELALLRALGFRRRRLSALVMLENAVLLLGGLAIGVVAALVAVLPHVLSGAAGLPWQSLLVTLASVLLVGMFAGHLAVRAVLAAPLLATLRGT